MADRVLRHGDEGPDVAVAQELLDRNGALLDTDGQFGGGTEAAVRECQTQASLPVTGRIDVATWSLLRQLPDPSPDIGTHAATFIAQKEVSSRAYYDAVETRPSYPDLGSGITIGVGYDLRYERNFAADWHGLLPPAVIATLAAYIGRQGTHDAVAELAGVRIPWFAAWTVYVHRTLPSYVAQTRAAFGGLDTLVPLCRGMLVSLVYNRGPGMDGDDRREMREIRDAVAAGNPAAVPDLLRAMKRLWPDTRGLRDRRDQEASLFEEGLRGAA